MKMKKMIVMMIAKKLKEKKIHVQEKIDIQTNVVIAIQIQNNKMLNNKEEKFLGFLRTLTIIFNIICLIFLIVTILLPDILTTSIKLLLIITTAIPSFGLLIALILSYNKEAHYTLFFAFLSTFLNGLIIGVSIVVIVIY